MEIREMRLEDIDFVYEISEQCFSKGWSKAALEKELTNLAATYIVAIEMGKVVGYAGLWKMADEAELINIAVTPKYRQRGIAGSLLKSLIEIGKKDNITAIYLEVREHNKAAQALYTHYQFQETGRRKKYYHDPEEDALLMAYYY